MAPYIPLLKKVEQNLLFLFILVPIFAKLFLKVCFAPLFLKVEKVEKIEKDLKHIVYYIISIIQ